MRHLPRSLFGQLVLVLFVILFLAQLLSAAILLRDRNEALSQAERQIWVQRIAAITRLLDAFSGPERQQIIAALDELPLRIAASDPPPAPSSSAASQRYAILFAGQLQAALGPGHRVVIRSRTTRGDMSVTQQLLIRFGIAPPPPISLDVRVALRDGSWVAFQHAAPNHITSWPGRLVVTLGILLFSVLLVSWLAVRKVTRPLRVLADAAEELGRDMHRPLLDEHGPLEVRRAAHAFNGMQQRLVRYIQDRARLLTAISHDLKTPVTRMRLRTELLDDGELKERFLKDLQDMEAMTAATLDFMRGAESREAVQNIDIAALLESLQADAEDSGYIVQIAGQPLAPYRGRPLALRRCLGNLLDNALHYGQRARVQIEEDRDFLRIRIADEGPGIPETDMERVFDPFFRLEGSRSRYTGGTGLGLGIARNIAQAHGGNVTLKNRPGGGLEALLVLPR